MSDHGHTDRKCQREELNLLLQSHLPSPELESYADLEDLHCVSGSGVMSRMGHFSKLL